MKIASSRFVFAAATLVAASSAFAATYQWDGNGATTGFNGNGNWSGANWDLIGSGTDDGTTTPTAFGATTDIARFSDGTSATITLDSTATIGGISMPGTSVGNTIVTINSSGSLHTMDIGSSGLSMANGGSAYRSLSFGTSSGGTMSVSNSGSLSIAGNDYFVLNSGVTWSQSGGVTMQSASGSSVSVTFNTGSTFTYTGASAINLSSGNGGVSGSATLNLSGGTFATKKNFNNSGSATSTGSANVIFTNGGTIQLTGDVTAAGGNGTAGLFTTSGTGGGGQVFNVKLGATTSGVSGGIIDTNGYSTSISQGIVDNTTLGSLTKKGAGTLTLSGTNGYTGTTTVNGGKLLVNGSLAAGSAVTVDAGAILGGSGTVNGAITVNGTLQGGVGTVTTDTLTTVGAVTLNSGSIVQLALGATGNNSKIAVGAGGIAFQTNQAFTFLNIGGVAEGNTYNLITGVATGLDTSGWTITNAGWAGTFTDNAGTISLTLTAVPEPSTYGLIGAGALAAVAFVRRRRRA